MATVNDILKFRATNQIYQVRPDISVYDAVKVMGENNAGSVLVMDQDGNMLGILTERDYARKIVLKGKRSIDTLVSEIMTPAEKIIHVGRGTSIQECMEKMSGKKIRHLPVLENGKPVSVISIGDVVSLLIREQEHTIQVMSNYIQGVNI